MWLRVEGLGFAAKSLGFRVGDQIEDVCDLGVKVYGLGSRNPKPNASGFFRSVDLCEAILQQSTVSSHTTL